MVCASPIMLDVYSADPNQAGVLRLGFSLPTPIPMPGLRTDSTAAHTKAIIPPCRSLGRAPRRPGPSTCIRNLLRSRTTGTCVRWKFWAPPTRPFEASQKRHPRPWHNALQHGAADKGRGGRVLLFSRQDEAFHSASFRGFGGAVLQSPEMDDIHDVVLSFQQRNAHQTADSSPPSGELWSGLAMLKAAGLD